MNSTLECPKCKKGILSFSQEEDLFVCQNCGSKFFKDAILNSDSTDSLYMMPNTTTQENVVNLPIQEETEAKNIKKKVKKSKFSLKNWMEEKKRRRFTKKWQTGLQKEKEIGKLVSNSITDFQRQVEIENLKFSKKGSK